MRRGPAVLALTLAVAAAAAVRVSGRAPACEFDGVPRIVAIGDIHGAHAQFLEILQAAALVDAAGKWTGGRTHLVQTGDVVDRGADSRKALDLLRRLEREAASAGGRVHALLGNHEAMRMLGDLRYVEPGEYAAFATPDSENVRNQVLETLAPEERDRARAGTPLGMIEMVRAFGPSGQYGAYLRNLNAVVRINGIVFLHGGISPTVASMTCSKINDTVRRELSSDFEKTRKSPLESLTAREDGPLWYRGLAQEPDEFEAQVDDILALQRARALVVGHTVQPGGRIKTRFGGKVTMLDTGMQPAYVATGRPAALEIRGDTLTAIYRDGREVVATLRSTGARTPAPGSEAR
jgi:hypothetical protein